LTETCPEVKEEVEEEEESIDFYFGKLEDMI